jgi:hypothetical protein
MNKRHFYWNNLFTYIILPLLLFISCVKKEDLVKYKDANLPVEERVEDLLSRMTLEEKIEQLSGLGFETKENKRWLYFLANICNSLTICLALFFRYFPQ